MANPFATVVIKLRGARKGIEARLGGLDGVFHRLAKQHGELMALMDLTQREPARREHLWPRLRVALLAHERAEARVVYGALARYEALRPFIERHGHGADVLEDLVGRLDLLTIETEAWDNLFATLRAHVAAQTLEEERSIFPIAIELIGHTEAEHLDQLYRPAHRHVESVLDHGVH
jgi:hypothetical protein